MINISIFTSTRAEYGLMKPLIKRLSEDEEFNVKLLVSGTHLSPRYGYTIDEIIQDNYAGIEKVDILSEDNDSNAISETMANAIVKFSRLFSVEKPDYLFIDGDRYESLAVAIAAVNNNIPIIHNGGGCTTEGAADEYYRHAITKMSMLHFTSTYEYRNRIIQMGEAPERVYVVGSLGIENILHAPLLQKRELSKQLGVDLGRSYAVFTYHPVTLEKLSYEHQINEILNALSQKKEYLYIITGANSDTGGEILNDKLRMYCKHNYNAVYFESLGMLRYLSALKYCNFVIGNSSSGLIEAPSFKIPTINIGDRQKGRIKADSVIDCQPETNQVLEAIRIAESEEFRKICSEVINPNGDGDTSSKIIDKIKEYAHNYGDQVQKSFYEIR